MGIRIEYIWVDDRIKVGTKEIEEKWLFFFKKVVKVDQYKPESLKIRMIIDEKFIVNVEKSCYTGSSYSKIDPEKLSYYKISWGITHHSVKFTNPTYSEKEEIEQLIINIYDDRGIELRYPFKWFREEVLNYGWKTYKEIDKFGFDYS
ncbi:hypothetical protein ACFYKT_18325 [Cytobacillus sp. FJAT-53684]|uniref:Uncharacterized protein n=1 Tax=Cytobacillus mangrovibacter TaxID=3299024 RepID=A0ABW6K5P1_9BACI